MTFSVIIPARYGSSRLPAKPLKDIQGLTMIERVYRQACQSDAASVVVATDDERIADVVIKFGGDVCMTSASHPSGTDRLQEVASKLAMSAQDIIVNVQGDEPLIPPQVINQVAANLAQASFAAMATLSEPIARAEDLFNPNIVKVVADQQQRALYFSRAPMPWPRDSFASQRDTLPESHLFQRHIGIYAYRVSLLNQFVTWPEASLEKLECLEQLRVLANGESIHVEPACAEVPGGVDTEADLDRVRAWLQNQ